MNISSWPVLADGRERVPTKEYCMIYRGPGFLPVVWFGSSSTPPSSPSPGSRLDRRLGCLRKWRFGILQKMEFLCGSGFNSAGFSFYNTEEFRVCCIRNFIPTIPCSDPDLAKPGSGCLLHSRCRIICCRSDTSKGSFRPNKSWTTQAAKDQKPNPKSLTWGLSRLWHRVAHSSKCAGVDIKLLTAFPLYLLFYILFSLW